MMQGAAGVPTERSPLLAQLASFNSAPSKSPSPAPALLRQHTASTHAGCKVSGMVGADGYAWEYKTQGRVFLLNLQDAVEVERARSQRDAHHTHKLDELSATGTHTH
jgi:hypothetical protein